ncbi:rubredoxin [bacterium (Candidatus Howlettbacteria) CG_4_10_14_0_8_um_filter_40_9]|nr:MAG: rubredoxin [bacterium (Candidatus Howlettbacteria) CG_4_10_14_0_8_um_filter_40_9]
MKKYICNICGWIYDEEDEGTVWEDLPADWVCPECGVGKDEFSLIES